MNMSKHKIGSILREYRKKNHLTQEQLSERVDITPGFLGQIERDETYPSVDNLTKIIQELNIDANVIFHPQTKELQINSELLYNEITIRFSKLKKDNQEIILSLMQTLIDMQNRKSE